MTKLLVAVITFAAILVSAAPVRADSFNFSFIGVPPLSGFPGTVTGRIDLNASNTAAQAIFITSSPPEILYPLSASDNFLAQPSVSITANSFTITNGALTAENFNAAFPISIGIIMALSLNSAFPQFHLIRVADLGFGTDRSVIARSADFVPVSEVPLLAALPLFATGLGALGLLGWRRKRKAAA